MINLILRVESIQNSIFYLTIKDGGSAFLYKQNKGQKCARNGQI